MNYYTYIYYDPSRNNEPIYVGKGIDGRAWKHFNRNDKHPFTNRLKYMKNNGVTPIIGIYGSLDEELALLVEEELIAKFGRKDLGQGPLLNLTDGGEGSSGWVQTEITKSKRAKSLLNHICPDSTKIAVSKAQTGRTKSISHRKKISETLMGNIPWNKGRTDLPSSWNAGLTVPPPTDKMRENMRKAQTARRLREKEGK